MTERQLGYPVFDADNHLYETEEALTKFLPDRAKNAIRYVELDGRIPKGWSIPSASLTTSAAAALAPRTSARSWAATCWS
jgi:hypothetical protein